ncbi:hypothetical protein ACOSQ2_005410 [Xanthoceras sorbifolium]
MCEEYLAYNVFGVSRACKPSWKVQFARIFNLSRFTGSSLMGLSLLLTLNSQLLRKICGADSLGLGLKSPARL